MRPETLRAIIDEFGLNQRAFAARLNVDHGTVNRWLTGAQRVYHPYIVGLAVIGLAVENETSAGKKISPETLDRIQRLRGILAADGKPREEAAPEEAAVSTN